MMTPTLHKLVSLGVCVFMIARAEVTAETCQQSSDTCLVESNEVSWSFVDDPSASLFPSRAIDHAYLECRSVKPLVVEQNLTLLRFHATKQNRPNSNIFVALNGASVGSVFNLENFDCLNRLANTAYDTLAPADWERRGPKFLYSSGGLPIRDAEDIVQRASRELHVLNSRQTWVWPAHRINLKFKVHNLTMTTASERPRVFLLDDILTGAECDAIIREYDRKLVPSPEKHYSDEFKDHRTSETGWMNDHPMRYTIQRILRLPFLTNVEMLQFLKYRVGKWYKHHHDYFHNYSPIYFQALRRWVGQRVASLTEIPSDWVAESQLEKDHEEAIREVSRVLKSVLQTPRGIPQIKLARAPTLRYVLDFEKTLSRELMAAVLAAVGLGSSSLDPQAYENIIEEHNLHDISHEASKVFAMTIGAEIGLDPKFGHLLIYDTEVDELDIIETEPLESHVTPNRHATVLPYLSDVLEGGETALPNARHPERFLGPNYVYPKHQGIPECSMGLIVKPKKGGAALFYHRTPNGDLDELSLHAGCPPKQGTKYAINGFTWNCSPNFGLMHYGE